MQEAREKGRLANLLIKKQSLSWLSYEKKKNCEEKISEKVSYQIFPDFQFF
jgi:hypothetical protein